MSEVHIAAGKAVLVDCLHDGCRNTNEKGHNDILKDQDPPFLYVNESMPPILRVPDEEVRLTLYHSRPSTLFGPPFSLA